MKKRLDTKQAAKYLGYTHPQTLANKRAKRQGPNYIKLGRRILYDIDDLDSYIDSHRVKLNS